MSTPLNKRKAPLLTSFRGRFCGNRLSRWAPLHRQFNDTMEYCKMSDHFDADVFSRLPVGEDPIFEREESTDDVDTICTIETLSLHAFCPEDQPTRVRCGKSLLEFQPWRTPCDSRERVDQRKKTVMTQRSSFVKSLTHLVFAIPYCMEPE